MYVTPPDTDVYAIPKVLAPMPQKVLFLSLLLINFQYFTLIFLNLENKKHLGKDLFNLTPEICLALAVYSSWVISIAI